MVRDVVQNAAAQDGVIDPVNAEAIPRHANIVDHVPNDIGICGTVVAIHNARAAEMTTQRCRNVVHMIADHACE